MLEFNVINGCLDARVVRGAWRVVCVVWCVVCGVWARGGVESGVRGRRHRLLRAPNTWQTLFAFGGRGTTRAAAVRGFVDAPCGRTEGLGPTGLRFSHNSPSSGHERSNSSTSSLILAVEFHLNSTRSGIASLPVMGRARALWWRSPRRRRGMDFTGGRGRGGRNWWSRVAGVEET